MNSTKTSLSSLASSSFADATTKLSDEEMLSVKGYRFYPTDEELVLFYLKKKMFGLKKKLEMIRVIDIYRCDPEDFPKLSILENGDKKWYFYSEIERKHPNSLRLNRASEHGQWRITGQDRIIRRNSRNVGVKKTLVFYRYKRERTRWAMNEFMLHEDELQLCENRVKTNYVLCKVFLMKRCRGSKGEQHAAPTVELDSDDDDDDDDEEEEEEDNPSMDVDVFNSSSDGENNLDDVLFGEGPSLYAYDFPELFSLQSPVHAPAPEITVDASSMVPQIVGGDPQDAEWELIFPEPEPPRSALPNGNGQPQEAPLQEKHPPNTQAQNIEIMGLDEFLGLTDVDDLMEKLMVEDNGFFKYLLS